MESKRSTRRDMLKIGAWAACGTATLPFVLPNPARAQSSPAGVRRVATGSGDDRLAIQTAINDLQAGGLGGVVELESGTYSLSSRLVIQNGVTIRGLGRATRIVPLANGCTPGTASVPPSGYCDDYLFEFRNPKPGYPGQYISQFNCRLENLHIVLLGNPNILAAVWAPSWNEQCGLRNVVITEYVKHAVLFTDAHGGSATIELRECEFMSHDDATNSHAGLLFGTEQSVAYTNVLLNHVVVTGPFPRVTDYVCVDARNGINVVGTGVHVEKCDHGVYLDGRSGLTVSGLTGGPAGTSNGGVKNLITCSSTFTGKVFGSGVLKAGATGYVLRDNKYAAHVMDDVNPLVFP